MRSWLLVVLCLALPAYSQVVVPFVFAPSAGAPPDNVLKDSLVAYWTMNEASGTRRDTTDNEYHLTLYSAPFGDSTGVIDSAMFINTNDFPAYNADTAFEANGVSFTIAGWLYRTVDSDWRTIAGKTSGDNNDSQWSLIYDEADTVVFIINKAIADNYNLWCNTSKLVNDQWFWICAWYDAAKDSQYISVNNAAPNRLYNPAGVRSAASPRNLFIGSDSNDGNSATQGRYDEWAFWRRVLTADERTALYNSGSGKPYGDWEGTLWTP